MGVPERLLSIVGFDYGVKFENPFANDNVSRCEDPNGDLVVQLIKEFSPPFSG